MRRRGIVVLAFIVAAVPNAPAQLVASSVCQTRPTATPNSAPAVVPIDVSNNHVFVEVCAAGRALEFILDTGAGGSFFDLTVARQLGLPLGASFSVRGVGAGTLQGAQVKKGFVTLAGTGIDQPVTSAIDFSTLPPREGHRIDGILGYDFIDRFVVAIDYAKQELRLYDRDDFHYQGPGTSLPVTLIGNHPHVDAEVRLEDGTIIKGRMVVDVGAAASLSLTKPWVDEHHLRNRIGPTVHRRGGGGVGGETEFEVGRVAALRLGNVELSRPITALYGDSAGVFSERGSYVGNIGGEILRRFTVFLDYQDKRMILEPGPGIGEPFEADMSGTNLVMNDSLTAIIVAHVAPSSPASDAGLVPGDTIVSVDDEPASPLVFRRLRMRFRREGERIVLTIRRGGETKALTLVTRRLV
jgi:hypothetical protein